jgi:prevent-host-death family protein
MLLGHTQSAKDLAVIVTHDYHVVMKKVGVAELKSRLSEYLRAVRKGGEITILDRDQPIARIIPHTGPVPLAIREPVRRYRTLGDIPLPPRATIDVDAVELLLEDRNAER